MHYGDISIYFKPDRIFSFKEILPRSSIDEGPGANVSVNKKYFFVYAATWELLE